MINTIFSYNEHGLSAEIFFQPLFFLGENVKQNTLKQKGLKVDEQMISDKLEFNNKNDINENISFEIPPINKKNDELVINYTLQRFNINYSFSYNGATFHIKHVELEQQNKQAKKINMDNKQIIYSAYEISYNAEDIEKFESFIKESVKYYDKYYLGFKREADKIKVFISADEGSYFQGLGNRQKRHMDTIYLPKELKKNFLNDINAFLEPKTKERYARLGIPYKRTYLLEGEMGSGKTSFITAVASTFNYNLAIVCFTPKMTETQLMKMLRNFNNEEGKDDDVLIVLEDIDCIFKERKSHDEARNSMSFSGILNALDGISTSQNRIVILTTQYMRNLDSALIRPGRVDYIMHFDYIVKEQVEDIFKAFTECEDKEKINRFCKLYFELNIKTSVCSLQQYLMNYLSNPDEAINNIDELKKTFDMSNISPKKAEETGLYM